jgi:glycosyltransferase involved in cell wall biosynthesis
LNILVATPYGLGGNGGIDRLMDSVRVELKRHPPTNMNVKFIVTRGPGSILVSPFYFVGALLIIITETLRGRADIVHINLSSGGSTTRKLMIATLCRILRVSYVIHLHASGYEPFYAGASETLKRRIGKMFNKASSVIVLGSYWKNYVSRMWPGCARRVEVLANATPAFIAAPTERSDDQLRILFSGKLGARKGTPELVEALGTLKNLENWVATLAGDGDIEKTRSAIQTLGIEHRVEIPGWVGSDDVVKLLQNADILVLPSFAENLPMSVIEGMAAGLAVIATPVGAVEDIIKDGDTGLLVPPGDAVALAAALKRLLDDPALRQRLGKAAQKFHAEHLEIGAYTTDLCDIWRASAAKNFIE